jgi:hypothetical protein
VGHSETDEPRAVDHGGVDVVREVPTLNELQCTGMLI